VVHQPIGELSKGFKQRVGLAHAMMNDPEILILDEPTSGLDPNQIVEIRDIIKQIGKEKTVVVSTHILSEAEATCDRIVIINRGKIVADANTETLKQSTDGEHIINISLENADFESVKRELISIEGISYIEPIDKKPENNRHILHLKLAYHPSLDLREKIYGRIKQTDWILLELCQQRKTLESVFRELTMEN
jgi:ABC-2 type transport system ATP-binding protein